MVLHSCSSLPSPSLSPLKHSGRDENRNLSAEKKAKNFFVPFRLEERNFVCKFSPASPRTAFVLGQLIISECARERETAQYIDLMFEFRECSFNTLTDAVSKTSERRREREGEKCFSNVHETFRQTVDCSQLQFGSAQLVFCTQPRFRLESRRDFRPTDGRVCVGAIVRTHCSV